MSLLKILVIFVLKRYHMYWLPDLFISGSIKNSKMSSKIQPLVLVHGGAGDIPDNRIQGKFDGVRKAASEGYKVLKETGSVLDSVVAAVKVMEDLEAFNAGNLPLLY